MKAHGRGAVHFCFLVMKAMKPPQERKLMIAAVPGVHPNIHQQNGKQ